MKTLRRILLISQTLLLLAAPMLVLARTPWIEKVPPREHARQNSMSGSPDAALAGELLYADHCAKCHGADADGKGRRPSLRSVRVQEIATPGDLHWMLVNGSLRRGMPSWSKLPDQQLWQIVTYLKTLKNREP
jgi:mono/diheme cytochrome c family protein